MTRGARCMLAILAGVAGCATSPMVLRSTGAGAVAFGASLAETELMVGSKASASGSSGDAACRYVEFGSLPGLRFTVENGVVTRADAGPGVRNELGVQLGDTTESVVSLYPDITMRRNPESAGGTDLILIDADGGHAIVMQAAGNKIISMRAGLTASVGSVKGCP